MQSFPLNSVRRRRAGAVVPELRVVDGVGDSGARPRHPSLGINQRIHISVHENRPWIAHPWPPQERLDAGEILRWWNVTVLERKPGSTTRVGAALGGYGVELARQGSPGADVAILENGGGIAADEVDCAVDGAVAEELTVGLCVQRVLVPRHFAPVEYSPVAGYCKCHGLIIRSSGGVLEPNVASNEIRCQYSWKARIPWVKCTNYDM